MERFSSLVTKSRPWPVIGRTIFFTSDKNRPTRDEIYFIDFWRENLSMYRINMYTGAVAKMGYKHEYCCYLVVQKMRRGGGGLTFTSAL